MGITIMTEFKMPRPAMYRGWETQVVLVTRENADYLAEWLSGHVWRDNLGRPIGIAFPTDRGSSAGPCHYAKYGHYVLRQVKRAEGEDIVLTQVVNEATAKHMMAQIAKGAA